MALGPDRPGARIQLDTSLDGIDALPEDADWAAFWLNSLIFAAVFAIASVAYRRWIRPDEHGP